MALLSACAAVTAGQPRRGQTAPPWLFMVRADPEQPQPRCPRQSAHHCRDDLDLSAVFDALNDMAVGAAWPFAAQPAQRTPADVQVTLGGGTFRLPRTLSLRDWPGTARVSSLLISGAGEGLTRITGTQPLPPSEWQEAGADAARLPEAARTKTKVVDLGRLLAKFAVRPPARRASGFGVQLPPATIEVFADGKPMRLARWPNTGWAILDGLPAGATGSMTIRGANTALWKDEPHLFVGGYFMHDWAYERLPVTLAEGLQPTVMFAGASPRFGQRAGQRVVVENALSELDSPDEWYLDWSQKRLYFWPAGGTAMQVEVSLVPTLLHVARSSQVRLKGIDWQGATADAIRIEAARDIVVEDGGVSGTGGIGIVVDGGQAVSLRTLAMSDLGEGGIVVSGGNRRTLAPANHTVEGCRIERFARLSRSYRPAIRVEGVGIQILKNRIAYGPHSAIVFNGNDHRIDSNHISDVVTETNDAGAIYTGRDWTARGTVISHNLLQNIYPRLPGAASVKGIYLDDQASGVTVAGNVFANVSQAVFIGGGRDNLVTRNLFVASSPSIFADNRGLTWQREQTQDPAGHLRRNFLNMPVDSEVYRSRYPGLAKLLIDEPGRTKYNRVTGNLFVASREYQFLDNAQTGFALDDNLVAGWEVFKALNAPKRSYVPEDFELRVPLPPRRESDQPVLLMGVPR